ncbi:hypothetical protein J3U99_20415 [Brucella pituitosa]|uniref:hypothetical protein n=1 Tax=Brucella pituitosa TaxID=571256 RepID=UPI002003309F|nr:hypothetical protein [Brucella pituitosa]MCK4207137.1 hypothetical protein [Brucella pituitosa]
MCVRIAVISGLCAALLNIGAATAMPEDMTVDRLLAICEAIDVQAATVKGEVLGWRRLTDVETEEWRNNFVNYNGGSVEVVGWRREKAGHTDLFSFWVAVGANGHKACSYSTARSAGLLDALSGRLGEPDILDRHDTAEVISASWTRGAVVYSFAQVGSSVTFAVGPSQ